jgi:hypothetical protein
MCGLCGLHDERVALTIAIVWQCILIGGSVVERKTRTHLYFLGNHPTRQERRRRKEDRRWLLDRREEMRGPLPVERRLEWVGRREEEQIDLSG